MDYVLKVGTKADDLKPMPTPDGYQWGLQDISAADSGRVNDRTNTMYKMRTSQKRKLQLSWTDPDLATASKILKAFNPEYVWVRYLDVMEGTFMVRQFYVGDRSAPFRSVRLSPTGAVVSTLSFDIIER